MHESSSPYSDIYIRHVEVLLQGGFGNQLFQLMYALNTYPSSSIVLNAQILRPRLNQLGELEISKLDLPSNVSIKSGRRSLIKKYTNLSSILRPLIKADSESIGKAIAFVDKARLSLIWLLLSLYFQKIMMLDFEGKRRYKSSNVVVAGFFMNDIPFDSGKTALIKKLLISNVAGSTLKKLQAKKMLGIHVRNGDYKDNPNFGILSIDYYRRAIESINEDMKFVVRIFAEEENYAADVCNMLTNDYEVEIITKHKISSELQTLQMMSDCDAFIMANSTFGWWGGLMISDQTNVFSPSPWFKSNPNFEPSYSPEWKKVSSTFQGE